MHGQRDGELGVGARADLDKPYGHGSLTVTPYTCIYGPMKTTVDLPDALVHRAKVFAARRRTTLRQLVVQGLEQVLNPATPTQRSSADATDDAFFETDAYGVPVLKRRGLRVTDADIEEIRAAEGI